MTLIPRSPARPDANAEQEAHPHGLSHDLPHLLGRRRLLTLLGGLGLGAASGLPAAAQAVCSAALPWETAGPYPADGTNTRAGQTINALTQDGILRRDITGSFGDHTGSAGGVPLELELSLMDASGCTPLEGRAIYAWHCDAAGRYSLYDAPGANWLRGLGVADEAGRVRFATIVPGCYPGRWPHVHFEVFDSPPDAISGRASRLTAQLAFPEDVVAKVYAARPEVYAGSAGHLSRLTLTGDGIFRDNTAEQIAQQTVVMSGDIAQGYTGSVTIPVDLTARR